MECVKSWVHNKHLVDLIAFSLSIKDGQFFPDCPLRVSNIKRVFAI